MDQRINQTFNDVIRLLQHLERETIESQNYAERNDIGSAIRNLDDSLDELANLPRKYQDLLRQLKDART